MAQKQSEKPAKGGVKGRESTPERASGGMLGSLIVAAGALASSFATVFLLTSPQGPQSPAPSEKTNATAPPSAKQTNHSYVELPDILVTIGSEPATRYVKLKVSIICNGNNTSKVSKSEPLLMDAFVNYLRSVELTDFEDPGFYAHLRDQLARRSQVVLGGEVSNGVLITEFMLR